MAFQSVNLFPAFAGNGQLTKVWSYTTTDSLATVLAAGYFNSDSTIIGIGDVINVSIVDALPYGSRTLLTEMVPVVVVTNSGGVVTTRLWDFSRNVVIAYDDFDGAVLSTKFKHPTKGSDGATVDFAIAIDVNGKLKGTT